MISNLRWPLIWCALVLVAGTFSLYFFPPDTIQAAVHGAGQYKWRTSDPPGTLSPDDASSTHSDPDGVMIASPSLSAASPAAEVTARNLSTIYDDPHFTGVRTLVIPKMAKEDTSWVEAHLGDLISQGKLIPKFYFPDDPTAPLHPPVNKGNEGMVYLTYIIDHYDTLSDISIFMHAHRFVWHNPELLDGDAVLMLRSLSGERVLKDGYMNLRCRWADQCPDVIKPHAAFESKHEWVRKFFNKAWTELFPGEELPETIAQPCCSQFAVSREAIRRVSKERYMAIRQWLIDTDLLNDWSGRIMEFAWQYIFTGNGVYCPTEESCHCEGYGLCFGSQANFESFNQIRFYHTATGWKLDDIRKEIDAARANGTEPSQEAFAEEARLVARVAELAQRIEELKHKAVQAGKLRHAATFGQAQG